MSLNPLPDEVTVTPVQRPIQGRVRAPGSKSITNRAVICAALAHGTSQITGALDSDDTRIMISGLKTLALVLTQIGTNRHCSFMDQQV